MVFKLQILALALLGFFHLTLANPISPPLRPYEASELSIRNTSSLLQPELFNDTYDLLATRDFNPATLVSLKYSPLLLSRPPQA